MLPSLWTSALKVDTQLVPPLKHVGFLTQFLSDAARLKTGAFAYPVTVIDRRSCGVRIGVDAEFRLAQHKSADMVERGRTAHLLEGIEVVCPLLDHQLPF